MCKQTIALGRKFVRFWQRYLKQSLDVQLLHLDKLCIFSQVQLRSKHKWQPDSAGSGFVFDVAHDLRNRNLRHSSKVFKVPNNYVKSEMKELPDTIF